MNKVAEITMTKEAMMDDLIKRSAADAAAGGSQGAAGGNTGAAAAEPVWQEAGGGFNLDLGKHFTNIIKSCSSEDIEMNPLKGD